MIYGELIHCECEYKYANVNMNMLMIWRHRYYAALGTSGPD